MGEWLDIPKDILYNITAKACDSLQEAANLPTHFRVKLDNLQ